DPGRAVSLHAAPDLLFHAAPVFLALTRRVRERLVRGGIGRGGARAAAHVAIELLIDGTLVTDPRVCHLYEQALRDADLCVACAGPGDSARLAEFLGRARRAGIPYPYADPHAVAGRVGRALAARPLLALDEGHTPVLASVLAEIAADVREQAPDLLRNVRRDAFS